MIFPLRDLGDVGERRDPLPISTGYCNRRARSVRPNTFCYSVSDGGYSGADALGFTPRGISHADARPDAGVHAITVHDAHWTLRSALQTTRLVSGSAVNSALPAAR